MIEVELFVAVLGASNYTYAEATRTQRLAKRYGPELSLDAREKRQGCAHEK